MTRWYRAYEGTTSDEKLSEAAVIAETSRSVVIACWHALLESAAKTQAGGTYDTTPRRVAAMLGEPVKAIEAVIAAFEEIGLIEGGKIVAWQKRQFESDTSTERSRKHRETKRNADATLQQRDATPPYTETETETDTETEKKAAAQLSAREKFELLESQLRQAAGWENEAAPNLFVTGPIANLIEAGADLERDVLPTIKAKAAMLRRPPGGGWSWFVPIIIEAREKRLGIAAKVAPAPVVAVTAEAWAARLGLYRKAGSWDREKWGPPPAEPGCEVPPELLRVPTDFPPSATATAA